MRVRRTNQPTSAFALRILVLLGVALALLVPAYVQAKRIEFAPPAQAAPAEWSQLGYTPQRTGYVPTTLEAVSRVRWIWNGPINSGDAGPASNHLALPEGVQPVAGGGNLYLGHSDGTVRALAETDGREVWITDLTASQGITNTLAYDADTNSVYAGTMGGRVYRLSASNGAVSGFVDLGGQILMAPLLVANHIYIGSTNGYFYALDKSTLQQVWSYDAGAALHGSPAYSANQGGVIIILAEDRSVHALRQSNGARLWRTIVNGAVNPLTNSVFVSTYPVVSDVNNVVIVRSFFDWNLTWQPSGGAPASISDIRSFLTANPSFQSFFVLDLVTGLPRYVAPVMGGAMGNGGIYYSPPPQAVVRRLDDGSEVAYLLWRNRQSCGGVCDGREDTTLGEMDLTTGAIRFVQDYKNQGSIRVPTDEQGVLAMAGNSMFHTHWMTLGGVRITDRSASLGATYANPIRTLELAPVVNTLASGTCPERDSIRRYCPSGMRVPEESYVNDPVTMFTTITRRFTISTGDRLCAV